MERAVLVVPVGVQQVAARRLRLSGLNLSLGEDLGCAHERR